MADIATLLTRLTTIDAAAERKFTAGTQQMVRSRTDRMRQLIGAGASTETLFLAAIDMKGWACFGSLRGITWLDRELDKLASYLEPEEIAVSNAEVAAHITNDLMEANR